MQNLNNSKKHPVWDVYDLYRTACLNRKYYSERLNKNKKYNFWIEIVLALSASSTFAGIWIWDTCLGSYLWKLFSPIAAVLAVFKTISPFSNKIKEFQEILPGWISLEHDLYRIKTLINQKKQYDKKIQRDFFIAIERKGELSTKDVEPKTHSKLLKKCYAEVNIELPVDSFYIPED